MCFLCRSLCRAISSGGTVSSNHLRSNHSAPSTTENRKWVGLPRPPEPRHGGFSRRLDLQQLGNDRVILCNFNGMLLQLPIESDDDNQSGRGSDGSHDDGIRDDSEDGSHDEGIHDDGVHDDEDGSQDDGIQEDEDGSHDDGCHDIFYDVEEGDSVIGDEEMDQSVCSVGASEEF